MAEWSVDELQRWRGVGDPPADAVIAEIYDEHGHGAVHDIMQAILQREEVEAGPGAEKVAAFLASERDGVDTQALEQRISAGQDVFAEHGPEVILILGTYSLPAAYAAYFGAKVLLQTGYLTNQPDRRLIETAQIIVDVMQPGGLAHGGIGRRSAEKTRLMHAAIRHLIIHRPDHAWEADEWGVPINQEDLAATLMTFSWIVLDGLRRMGVRLSEEEAQSYLEAWREVGRIMGVVDELIPTTVADAERLTRAIQDHQVLTSRPSDSRWAGGRQLTAALIPVLDHKMLPGVPASLMHLFLPRTVTRGLGVPRAPVRDTVVLALVKGFGWLDSTILSRFSRGSRVLRGLSMELLNGILQWERGGDRAPFRIPDSLDWYEEGRRTIGQRTVERIGRR